MNILVTGGCGFIGSNLVRYLLTATDGAATRVVNLDLLTYAGNPTSLADLAGRPDYRFVKGDIGDQELVGRLLRDNRIDLVLNLAAESHVDRSIDSPEPFIRTNVTGTLGLLEAVRHYLRDLDPAAREAFRLLHVSTDEVYGSLGPDDPSFCETTAYAPNSPYAASKASADHLVRAYHHTYGLPFLTTNCSNNYGPYQFPEKLIPLMILNALEGKPLPVYGDGANVRDWLYVGDHCSALWLVARQGRPGQTYNIGGACEHPNITIVNTLCRLLDQRRPRPEGPYTDLIKYVKDRPGHDRRYAVDFGKLHRELGWAPTRTLETGLAETVDWYLGHQEWCADISENRYQRQRLGTD
ncbi:MAG: dTDP-glucose 4,6-dehydratase [Opitutaceae bacterium]